MITQLLISLIPSNAQVLFHLNINDNKVNKIWGDNENICVYYRISL